MLNDLTNVIRNYEKVGKRNSKKDEKHLNKHAMHLVRLFMMALDILDQFDEIKVCVGYELNGQKLDCFPMQIKAGADVKPVYETLPGWKSSTYGIPGCHTVKPTYGIRDYAQLPENAKKYIERLEQLTGVKVGMISTSPEREDTIVRVDPYKA